MRYYIVSVIFHIILILALTVFGKKHTNLQNVGKNVKINMTAFNTKTNSGKREDLSVRKKEIQKPKKKKGEKKKPTEKNLPEKTPEKKPEKKPKPKPAEDKNVKKIPEEIKEEPAQEESVIVGTPEGTEDKETPEEKSVSSESYEENDELGEGFVKLADGSLAAKHQGIAGLTYGFISKPEPEYPSLAKKLGYKKEMIVKVRLLIDEDGKVQEIKLYTERDKYGFCNEVEKVVSNWKLTPIKVGNKKVKMYIFKSFRFKIED